MSTYKKLTNTNVASIPFNANKQWSFTSASATTDSIGVEITTANFTSASLHTYSSASTDLSSSIKYHQTDHLFYKDYKENINNRLGNANYLEQQRELYNKLNTLSIPSGLYGLEIKPGTFYFSGSADTKIVDDGKGNLIISGTDLTNHNIDVRQKIFHLGPVKGFKNYDIKSQFYVEKEDPNSFKRYYSQENEIDDSYYLNHITYKNILFSEEILGPELLVSGNFNNGLDGFTIATPTGSETLVGIISGSGSNAAIIGGESTFPFISQTSTQTPGIEYEIAVNVTSASLESTGSQVELNILNDDSIGAFYDQKYPVIAQNLHQSGNLGIYKKRFIANKSNFQIYVADYEHKVVLDSVSLKKVDAFPAVHFENNITKGPELIVNGNLQDIDGEDIAFWSEQDTDNVATYSPIVNGVRVDFTGSPTNSWWVRLHQALDGNVGRALLEEGKTYKLKYESRSNLPKGIFGRISKTNGQQLQVDQEDNYEETHRFRESCLVFTVNRDTTLTDPDFPSNLALQFYSRASGAEIGAGHFFEVRNVSLKEVDLTSHSSIVSPHKDDYNFNPGDDFTISMYVNPYHNAFLKSKLTRNDSKHTKSYLLSKSTTKTVIPTPLNTRYGKMDLKTTGSSQPKEVPVDAQFPFEIYVEKINNFRQNVVFTKTDGDFTPTISASIATGSYQHLICMTSASRMEIWLDGNRVASGSDTTVKRTQNPANLYFGSKGEKSNFFSGSMSNIMIFNQSKTSDEINNIKNTFNNSCYLGNIFYSNGLATVTHPSYQYLMTPNPYHYTSGSFNNIQFKGSHTIYENEYQCTVEAHEYNYSNNVSTRKIQTDQHENLANFATGSIWAPYVTTIGLYDDNHELLVVGKLGQPIKMSEETDTTFIIKWDT